MNSSSWTGTNYRYAFETAQRCGARTKQKNGNPCRCPAVRGKKRCRIHGGSKGSGAQQGNLNALKHGYTTQAIKAFKKEARLLIKEAEEIRRKLS